MSTTYGGYVLKTGSTPSESGDAGTVVVSKSVALTAAGTGAALNQDFQIQIPAGSLLIDVIFDTPVAHTSTTAAISLGTAAGGAQYVASTDIKANARVRPTLTTTLAAFASTGAVIHGRLALGGTTTATGQTRVTLLYIQQ